MSERVWTLCDVASDRHVDGFEVSFPTPQGSAGFVRKRTLRGGLRDGVEIVEIDQGSLFIAIVPSRGMGLWKVRRGSTELSWRSPVQGPVHPKFVPLEATNGIGWLAGFDELLCRCGLESNGAPEWTADGKLRYGLHGRIANLPAHRLTLSMAESTGEIRLTGEVDEARLFGANLRLESTLETRVGSPALRIIDRVHNRSASANELELLYHVNIGAPFLSPGAKVHVPIRTLAPRTAGDVADLPTWNVYPEPRPGAKEVVMFTEPVADSDGKSRATLENATGDQGATLSFGVRTLPYFALWKNPLPIEDGYVTGLEPCLNFPNPKSFERERGRVVQLAPGESRRFELGLEVHASEDEVRSAREKVHRLQAGVTPTIHREPRADWSA